MNSAYLVVWAALAASVLGLAFYQKLVAEREDDSIHIGPGEENIVVEQKQMAAKLAVLDRWGKTLTAIAAAYGLLIMIISAYEAWLVVSVSYR
jgi:hypothetical protein